MIGVVCFETLQNMMASNGFHIYDSALAMRLKKFVRQWGRSLRHVGQMDMDLGGLELRFEMPMDLPKSQEQYDQFNFTSEADRPMRSALEALLKHVRNNYLEIDPANSGEKAMGAYEHQRAQLRK